MSSTAMTRKKETGLAYLLWVAGFFGFSGLHRMYMGRWVSGLIWLFTGGLCMVGQIVDLIMMERMLEDSEHGRGW